MYYKEELELLTVKQLREIIQMEQYQVPGAWKAKKQELIEGILFGQDDEEDYQMGIQLLLAQDTSATTTTQDVANVSSETFEEEVEEQPKKKKTRKNMNSLYVTLNDETTLVFHSNKEFAEYFNKKHETNFRNDIAWYIVRGRNKKAKEVFEIAMVEEVRMPQED